MDAPPADPPSASPGDLLTLCPGSFPAGRVASAACPIRAFCSRYQTAPRDHRHPYLAQAPWNDEARGCPEFAPTV